MQPAEQSDAPEIPTATRANPCFPDKTVIAVWAKYEDVAVHFNDLIMRWRLQAIGGLAGLVTLAGFVVGDAEALDVRYRAMLILSAVLVFGWVGVACLDLFYYRLLLKGAVKALLRLERSHPALELSRRIEQAASGGALWAPVVFYLCGLLPLLGIVGWAVWQLCSLDAGVVAVPVGQP